MGNLIGKIKGDAGGKGLWILVDDELSSVSKGLIDEESLVRSSTKPGGVAFSVLPEEIEAIRDACNSYLRDKDTDTISIIWGVDDVFTLMYDEEQDSYSEDDYAFAREVLRFVEDHHDASIGVSWDTLQWAIDTLNRGE